jgi:septum formation protein
VTRLVLGSASTGRLRVLRSAGIDPLVAVSGLDEDAIIAGLGAGTDPATVVNALAEAKARAVGASLDPEVAADAVVIGCDSMLDIDGELRGKPQTPEHARRQWNSMAGRSGQLFTGHCLIRLLDGDPIRVETAAAVTSARRPCSNSWVGHEHRCLRCKVQVSHRWHGDLRAGRRGESLLP